MVDGFDRAAEYIGRDLFQNVYLAPGFGDESLRYAPLVVCTLIMPWSAWHCWRASKTIEQDFAVARA